MKSTPNHEKSNAMQFCNKRAQNDACINYAERWQYRRSQYAILHQFAVFSFVLTTGNLLCQTLILQALQATTDTARLTLVAE